MPLFSNVCRAQVSMWSGQFKDLQKCTKWLDKVRASTSGVGQRSRPQPHNTYIDEICLKRNTNQGNHKQQHLVLQSVFPNPNTITLNRFFIKANR